MTCNCEAQRILGDELVSQERCLALNCIKHWAVIIPAKEIQPKIMEAVFGPDVADNVKCMNGLTHLAICWRHYRSLRTKDGYTLGYRKVNGRIVAYVKQEHF